MSVKPATIQAAQDAVRALNDEILRHLADVSGTMSISQGTTGLDPQNAGATMEVVQQGYKLWYTLEAFKRVV